MIRINLATRKRSAVAGIDAKGGKASGVAGAFGGVFAGKGKVDFNALKDWPLLKIVLMLAVAIGANILLQDFKDTELKKLDPMIVKLTEDKTRLEKEVKKTKGYDELKKQLDADEFALKKKLETIQKLVADRQTPPKILVSMASAIPADVWLTSFEMQENNAKFIGASLGFNQVSDFMKTLNESAYFTDLRLSKTEQGKEETDTGFDATFELEAKRRRE